MTSSRMVSGLAVTPGVPHSLHLTKIPLPELGRDSVQIRVLDVGICGTDREIIESRFGYGPPDSNELVLGHEVLGEVEEVGSAIKSFAAGDLVTATVRRGCGCPQCSAGESDFCTSLKFTEGGIRGAHGYITDRFVESA